MSYSDDSLTPLLKASPTSNVRFCFYSRPRAQNSPVTLRDHVTEPALVPLSQENLLFRNQESACNTKKKQ